MDHLEILPRATLRYPMAVCSPSLQRANNAPGRRLAHRCCTDVPLPGGASAEGFSPALGLYSFFNNAVDLGAHSNSVFLRLGWWVSHSEFAINCQKAFSSGQCRIMPPGGCVSSLHLYPGHSNSGVRRTQRGLECQMIRSSGIFG